MADTRSAKERATSRIRELGVKYVAPRLGLRRGGDDRRMKLLDHYCVSTVLDVGANVGQYGGQLRKLGYRGRIISFEPLSSAYEGLQAVASDDPLWEVYNLGLGATATTALMNVAENSWSSSLLTTNSRHIAVAPGAKIVATSDVYIETLDNFLPPLEPQGTVLLKIDTQGWELEVLRGGQNVLAGISMLQLEMSLVGLYKDEPTFSAVHQYVEELGYRLIGVEPGVQDANTGELLQLDGIYRRSQDGV